MAAVAPKLLFMQSDGGLCSWKNFSGLRAILSGPAGGVIGYAQSCFDPATGTPVIGFDMGGTSTDVSRFSGKYDHVFESETAEVTLQTPQLDINTVAAGGGSILHWKNGLFAIGPDVSQRQTNRLSMCLMLSLQPSLLAPILARCATVKVDP